MVVAVGEDYIVLSRTDCDKNSDIPQAGDNISQLGNRTDKQRQAAIVLSAYGDDAPSYKQYNGIDSYSLEGKQVTKLSPFGNELTGKLNIEQGSTGWENIDGLPNSIQNAVDLANKAQETIDNTSVGAVNLLKNSGFTGDYQTEELSEKGIVGDENDMYSQNLLNWGANAEVIEETNAVSGYAVKIGSIEQTVNPLMVGEKYVLSCKAKGTSLTITCGSHTETFELKSSYAKAVSKFTFKGSKKLEISGDATLCDLQLERGTISTDWGTSPFDNDKAFAEFLGMSYIYDAIKNGSTSVLGGLILSNMIQLGKYKESNGQMTGETKAGISGIYNNDNDVAFWGGGTFEEAIKTVTKFKSDPRYKPTEEEWKGMANFVISHGGDAFFRGYVYALGGFFRGAVEIANGKIMLNQDGSGWLADKGIEWDKKGIMYRKATDVIRWTRPERNMIDFEDGSYFDISCQFKESPSTIELHSAPVDGYRICISLQKYRNYGSNILWGNFLILNPETKNLVDSFYISIYEWCTEEFWLTYHKSGNYWSLESSKYTITSEKTILGASNVVIFGESDKADSRSLVSEKKIKTPKIEVTGTDDESIKTDGGIKAVKLVLTGTEQKSKFLASPSGAEGSPSFRAIKEADIPEYKELKAKVADIEDSLSNIENNTGSNNSEIQALKTSVDSVKKQISTIEASITNLNTRVKNIEDLIEQ